MGMNGYIPFLPEEIIVNILKRVPVKSLKQFQCVCKHWKNLFTTPLFIQLHHHHSTHQNPSLLFEMCKNSFYTLSFNSDFQFRKNNPLNVSLDGLCIFGSSNGLLLLCFLTEIKKHPTAPLLWNPATREVRKVPMIPDHFSQRGYYYGFGFIPIANDYKIVRFCFEVGKAEVFSLSTWYWRNIQFDNIKDLNLTSFRFTRNVTTANGVMFWQGSDSPFVINNNVTHIKYATHNTPDVILSFDIALEMFSVIPCPEDSVRYGVKYGSKLAVYDGKLAIISFDKHIFTRVFHEESINDDISLYFLVMGEGAIGSARERWRSSRTYTSNFGFAFCDGTIWKNQIVCIDCCFATSYTTKHRTDNIHRLFLIDIDTNECKQIDMPRPNFYSSVYVFDYVESPVSIGNNIQIKEA